MTCIEIPYAAYELASNKKLILPQISSELRLSKPDILSGLNIKPGKIFSPFNIETDDRFEMVLDWTDYRLTQDQRNKDAILAKIFDLIEIQDYVLQENLTTIGARVIWKTRSIPLLWNILGGVGKLNELPPELPLKQIVTTAKLNKVGNIILSDLRKWQAVDPSKVYTMEEVQSWLQKYVVDGRERYSMGQRSDLHIYFRPQTLQQYSMNKFKDGRKPSSAEVSAIQAATCDLSSDRCNGKPLDEAQTAKTLFLTDIVSQKLSQIEAEEKAKGRDFKVAIISRMGSNLSNFQPLIDVNSQGQSMNLQQVANHLINESKSVKQNYESGDINDRIEYATMRSQFDRSRNLKYSHVGIAVKNLVIKDKSGAVLAGGNSGEWAMVHLLYSCDDKHQSYIYKGTLGNFFYDHMYDYGAQIMVPEQNLQNNIDQIITKDILGNNWAEKQYNALALTNDLNQQNSNQWVLEVIAAAMYPAGEIKDRKQSQEILRKTNYSATKVTPTGLYSLLTVPGVGHVVSNMMPTVCLNRQDSIKKYGMAEIISALSVEEYLAKNKRMNTTYEVELTAQDKADLDKALIKPKKQKIQDAQNY